ncbi:hypothetical protein N7509_000142 [Penicillium cosmopolitanum]|uniref:Uncharacterized protein n=1 Tax=Penicillium cosmopolitanum TaxID=1131564 RepID=A0A9W9WCQ3_9EURO|nr:uncharacterized protein N7509_000142 [Penicillium cosmopolitanum]XP_057120162.1 uncharacterized protein N7481_010266 [Penicillium waksmanii]KAJ5415044.1 hypothetical protein N7509_000142 [Penicillium cosmopolitanum]KAJ5976559.1 hypothetical protein N7481_010266 [Penicillium waksmanii]
MSDDDNGDSELDEEIHQFSKNLERMRKRRRLIELQAQIAEERKWLQEAQERLDNARRTVGPDAFASVSHQSSVVPRSSVVPNPPVISESTAFSVAPAKTPAALWMRS